MTDTKTTGRLGGVWFRFILPPSLDPVQSHDGSVMIIPSLLSIEVADTDGTPEFVVVCQGKRATAKGQEYAKGPLHQTDAEYAQRLADPWLAEIRKRWSADLEKWLPLPELPPPALTPIETDRLEALCDVFGAHAIDWPDDARDRALDMGLLRHDPDIEEIKRRRSPAI